MTWRSRMSTGLTMKASRFVSRQGQEGFYSLMNNDCSSTGVKRAGCKADRFNSVRGENWRKLYLHALLLCRGMQRDFTFIFYFYKYYIE